MILSGEQKEDYREIKPYYTKRLYENLFMPIYRYTVYRTIQRAEKDIRFRNGYSKNSPSFVAKCTLEIDTGKSEWGAEPNKMYYILKIIEIRQVKGVKKDVHRNRRNKESAGGRGPSKTTFCRIT